MMTKLMLPIRSDSQPPAMKMIPIMGALVEHPLFELPHASLEHVRVFELF